jgi:hypothetical protein
MDKNNAWQLGFAIAILVTIVATGLVGCAPDITETDFYSLHPDPESTDNQDLLVLGTQVVGEVEVTLLARAEPHAGVNELLVQATRQGTAITNATVQAVPRSEGRVSPLEAPFAAVADEDGYLRVPAHFLQRKGTTQQWTVDISIGTPLEATRASFDLVVIDSLWMQEFVHDQTGDVYFVSWIEPQRPATGDASFELAIYRLAEDGFVGINDATIDLYPYMDMGAGEGHSTPFKAPRHTSGALYTGRINFIMSGGWDMTVRLRVGQSAEQVVVFRGFTVY